MKLPISVYTTITVQVPAALENPTQITGVAIGTSPQRPRITDTGLNKPIAMYPAYASSEDGRLRIYTAMEFGTSLGVYEIGIYAGDQLIATINQKSRYEINKPIFTLRHDRTYIFDIGIDGKHLDGLRNRGALHLDIDERDDITYPMAMAIQSNAALSQVAGSQEQIAQELAELMATTDENVEMLKAHQADIETLKERTDTHEADIAKLKDEATKQQTDAKIDEVKQLAEQAMKEALNKVRLKSKHDRLLIMHDVEENKYELYLTDVAKASNLAAEIIRRQHENARIREEIEEKIEGKLDETQVRALIAEAELDDVSRDEIKLKIIEAVAGKMSDERVRELLSHKLDMLEATNWFNTKADLDYVNEQLHTKANHEEVQLQLMAKVDDTELAQIMQDYRLEWESKIAKVDDKANYNHLLIDELTKNQAADSQIIKQLQKGTSQLANLRSQTERLVILRDEESVTLRLDDTPTGAEMTVVKSDIAHLNNQMNALPEQMNRIAKEYIDTLTHGASGAMDTFAEVEAALENGNSVATGIINQINKLQQKIEQSIGDEAVHRQFTGFKTATNLTQIVALILSGEES